MKKILLSLFKIPMKNRLKDCFTPTIILRPNNVQNRGSVANADVSSVFQRWTFSRALVTLSGVRKSGL